MPGKHLDQIRRLDFAVATTGSPNPAIVELALLQHGISVNPPASYPGNYGKFGGTDTFDSGTIDRELGRAADFGFGSMRV